MTRQPFFYDITLRDGNQSLKKPWNINEKEFIFNKLVDFGVQAVEAGFPAASEMDFEAVQRLAQIAPENLVISGLARAVEHDILKAVDAIKSCKRPRVHTFIAMSPFNMKYVLNKDPQEVRKTAIDAVKFAKEELLKVNKNGEVQFSVEHFGDCMENLPFVIDTLKEIVQAGATVINLPNTVERTRIKTFVDMVAQVYEALPKDIMIAVHCHNDLGMATANTLSGVLNGARQVEVTVNGVGERAGNTAMEEVVMAVKCRKDIPVYTDIVSRMFNKASHSVSTLMRMPVQPNKAIVGRNAFAHSSGIHQDGVLKNRESYEIIDPADVGVNDSTIELTARSGRAALKHHFPRLGIEMSKEELDASYQKFLQLADAKKEINDSDLLMLAGVTQDKIAQKIRLKYLQVVCGKNAVPMATVKLVIDGEECTATSSGNGPIDAAFQAVKSLVHRKITLEEFLVQAITRGTDDVGKVHIQIENRGNIYYGFSANTDIVTASVEAYVNAISKIL